MLHFHNDGGLSGHGLMTSLGEGKDKSFDNITANWVITNLVMTQFAVILLNDLLRGSQHCGSLVR